MRDDLNVVLICAEGPQSARHLTLHKLNLRVWALTAVMMAGRYPSMNRDVGRRVMLCNLPVNSSHPLDRVARKVLDHETDLWELKVLCRYVRF